MSMRDTYLTDEELQQLIVDVETRDLVSAPPNILDDILVKIETPIDFEIPMKTTEQAEDIGVKRRQSVRKKKEFQLYCFRVISSVAAAIMLLFILPKVSETMPKTSEVMQEMTAVYEPQITLRYETKEEALNDKSFLAEAFGNSNLFDNDFEWNIFK